MFASRPPRLPAPPDVRVRILHDEGARGMAVGGFLDVHRLTLSLDYPEGKASAPFPYDVAHRQSLDAVAMVPHFMKEGIRHVFLRSAVRPPVLLRHVMPEVSPAMWEVSAGLLDEGETPRSAARRELEEELGFSVDERELNDLGWLLPTPAVIGERIVFFHVEVDPHTRKVPTEDGSALERGASILTVPLQDALFACKEGEIRDMKTEILLRRLEDALGGA